ncbi:MAG: hypothetical protein ACP5I8_04010 [Phycisphaerae bacterium]
MLRAICTPPRKAMDELWELYAQLDVEVAAQKLTCNSSGRCCQFEIWGHKLYVSTLELAYFRHKATNVPMTPAPPRSRSGAIYFPLPLYGKNGDFTPGCPWQMNALCTAREGRPLGCRVYFCDAATATWQSERYEYYHHKISDLHKQFDLPYRYMEWRSALALIMLE